MLKQRFPYWQRIHASIVKEVIDQALPVHDLMWLKSW